MASPTSELLRLSSTPLSPLEYFTDSSSTHNFSTDVVLVVGKEKFYCHRLLLSLVSPVFARMFDGQFKEHNEREIALEGKSSEAILDLLKYIYPQFNGQITNDNVDNFLQLADEYMIDHLKQPCKDLLVSQLQQFKFVSLPTQEKLLQPTPKTKNFHASDSALNSSRNPDENALAHGSATRHHPSPRPTSTSRHTVGKPTSSYLKPGDKSGSSSNTTPRHFVFLDKTRMPSFYDAQDAKIAFTHTELDIWLRRLGILYQIDKGRNYGEVIDCILSILQFIPANLLLPRLHITPDNYAAIESMLNDVARARMHVLEEWATDGNRYRPVALTESYRTTSLSALTAGQQTAVTSTKTAENEQSSFQSVMTITSDHDEPNSSLDTDTE